MYSKPLYCPGCDRLLQNVMIEVCTDCGTAYPGSAFAQALGKDAPRFACKNSKCQALVLPEIKGDTMRIWASDGRLNIADRCPMVQDCHMEQPTRPRPQDDPTYGTWLAVYTWPVAPALLFVGSASLLMGFAPAIWWFSHLFAGDLAPALQNGTFNLATKTGDLLPPVPAFGLINAGMVALGCLLLQSPLAVLQHRCSILYKAPRLLHFTELRDRGVYLALAVATVVVGLLFGWQWSLLIPLYAVLLGFQALISFTLPHLHRLMFSFYGDFWLGAFRRLLGTGKKPRRGPVERWKTIDTANAANVLQDMIDARDTHQEKQKKSRWF